MSSDISVTIRFFGGFKEAGDKISMTVPTGIALKSLKQILNTRLGDRYTSLIAAAAFTDHEKILHESTEIATSCDLGILPPVCGG